MEQVIKYIYSEQELPQKTKNWLDARITFGLGASQVPILMGNYPPHWATPYDLFLEKMGKPQKPMTEDMERGIFEDQGRSYLENYLNNCKNEEDGSVFCRNVYDRTSNLSTNDVKFEQFTVISKDVPNLFASFDGIDINNKLVLEIKCPKQGIFNKLLRNRVPSVPKTYLAQVQSQLMIANSHWGITKGIFAVFFPDGLYYENKKTGRNDLIRLIVIETELDEEYCEEIKNKCKIFWDMVENRSWNKYWDK